MNKVIKLLLITVSFCVIGHVRSSDFNLQEQTRINADSLRQKGASEDCVAAVAEGLKIVASLDGKLKQLQKEQPDETFSEFYNKTKTITNKAGDELGYVMDPEAKEEIYSFERCRKLDNRKDRGMCNQYITAALFEHQRWNTHFGKYFKDSKKS